MSEFESANYHVPLDTQEDQNRMNDPPRPTETDDQDELLGLDQQLKISKRAKVAKLDQERLMGKTGISYIVKNHQKVNRIIKKNDKRLKPKSKQEKYEHESQNLASVLQFYQLWCHTLFPKANFRDCLQLIRAASKRSPGLRIYRRELLDREIYKLKVEKGVIDVPEPENAIDVPQHQNNNYHDEHGDENNEASNEQYNVDDDFSFMNRGNALFVGNEDEELYTTPPEQDHDMPDNLAPQEGTDTDKVTSHAPNGNDDEFSDDDRFLLANDIAFNREERSNDYDDHDEELAIMNELGM